MKANKDKIDDAKKFAQNLMSKMTLPQKVGQISQFGRSIYNGNETYYEDHYPEGKIGSYLTISGAEKLNRIQKRLIAETPHHIPALFAYDVIHGYKTTFPTPLTQSQSWEPETVAKAAARVAAKEAYAAGIKWTFSPMVDVARDPRWGRIMEGYGEDPYLCSKFAAATVEGYQGDEIGGEDSIIACAKHFVTYGACIGGRDYNSADMSIQTLFDTYLPPFQAAFDAGAPTCMPAFNDFNGIPCTCNTFLLQDVLRKQMGFDGVTISDFNAVRELMAHNVCDNEKDAVSLAFNAGVDVVMAYNPYNDHIPTLVKEGRVKESDVDAACERILVLKYLLGLFDDPFVDEKKEACFFCEEHRQVARNAAKRCAVLLKNENGVLPVSKDKKIAVVGPLAKDGSAVLGNWAGVCEADKTITVLQGLMECYGKNNIIYAKGCDIEGTRKTGFAPAIRAVKNADIAIVAVGEAQDMSGEAKSRADLRLTGVQEEFIRKVAKTGTPVIVVVFSGRPLVLTDWRDTVQGIIFAGQPGTETGHGIADVVSGDYNPSGRLTCSFPYDVGQIPCYYNSLNTGRPALGKVWYESKYIDMQVEPAYPFGYGLSYTTFQYSNLKLSSTEIYEDDDLEVCVDVENIGDRDGEEVVELYVRDVVGTRARPMKELKGFTKVFLQKGERRTVHLTIKGKTLSFHNWQMQRVVEPGSFKLWIGKNAHEMVLESEFRVASKK